MDNIWIHIVLYAMPWEIDKLELLVHKFNSSKYYLKPNHRVSFNVVLNVSDSFTDWDKSKLPKEFFVDKFRSLIEKLAWGDKNYFHIEHEDGILFSHDGIQGCSDIRRKVINEADAEDYILWLDPDIYFSDISLISVFNTIEALNKNNQKGYKIISPEIVRYWDESWDSIVNEEFKNSDLGQLYNFDVYEIDSFVFRRSNNEYGVRLNNEIKFGGGLFTTFSADLLKLIGIPEELGHYGYEDAHILYCSMYMKQFGYNVNQYIISNLLVAEDKKFLPTSTSANDSADDRIVPYYLVYNDYLVHKQKTDDIRSSIKEKADLITKQTIDRLHKNAPRT